MNVFPLLDNNLQFPNEQLGKKMTLTTMVKALPATIRGDILKQFGNFHVLMPQLTNLRKRFPEYQNAEKTWKAVDELFLKMKALPNDNTLWYAIGLSRIRFKNPEMPNGNTNLYGFHPIYVAMNELQQFVDLKESKDADLDFVIPNLDNVDNSSESQPKGFRRLFFKKSKSDSSSLNAIYGKHVKIYPSNVENVWIVDTGLRNCGLIFVEEQAGKSLLQELKTWPCSGEEYTNNDVAVGITTEEGLPTNHTLRDRIVEIEGTKINIFDNNTIQLQDIMLLRKQIIEYVLRQRGKCETNPLLPVRNIPISKEKVEQWFNRMHFLMPDIVKISHGEKTVADIEEQIWKELLQPTNKVNLEFIKVVALLIGKSADRRNTDHQKITHTVAMRTYCGDTFLGFHAATKVLDNLRKKERPTLTFQEAQFLSLGLSLLAMLYKHE